MVASIAVDIRVKFTLTIGQYCTSNYALPYYRIDFSVKRTGVRVLYEFLNCR